MTSQILLLALLSAVPLPANQEKEKTRLPSGPPPQFAVVSKVDKDIVEMTQILQAEVPVVQEIKIVVNGREQTEQRTSLRKVQQTVVRRFERKKLAVFSAGGASTVPEALKEGAVVLLSEGGMRPDSLYLKVLQPNTLIVVMPYSAPAAVSPPRAPVPVPLPPKKK